MFIPFRENNSILSITKRYVLRRGTMTAGAIVTAAGRSSRMGDFKPLMKIGGISVAERVVMTLREAGIGEIVVITGRNAEELENCLRYLNVVFLRNDMYESNDMFESVRIGLNHLKDRCDKVIISPVDVPLFSADTVNALLESEAGFTIPTFNTKPGHPVVIYGKAVFNVSEYQGDGGLRGAAGYLSLDIVYIEVPDNGILYDMDTRADYDDIVRMYDRRTGG